MTAFYFRFVQIIEIYFYKALHKKILIGLFTIFFYILNKRKKTIESGVINET